MSVPMRFEKLIEASNRKQKLNFMIYKIVSYKCKILTWLRRAREVKRKKLIIILSLDSLKSRGSVRILIYRNWPVVLRWAYI